VRAIVVHRPGGHDRLAIEASPDPRPGPGEVCVATEAIGVNYADCVVRMGLYESAKRYVGWPITPGFEVAGRIVAVGRDVRDASVGDEVMAVTRFGGYATHVVVPRTQVFARPPSLSMQEAAAFPTVHLTAWYALRELVRLRRGMRVLVHSAAGGVGSALVQIARIAGCEVVGVVGSSTKIDAVRALGADHVIDKSRGSLFRDAERISPSGYEIVLDANGVSTLRGSYEHLAPTGRLVIYGFHSMLPKTGGRPRWGKLALDWMRTPRFSPLAMCGENRSVLAFNLSYLFERADLLAEAMGELGAWLADGSLRKVRVTTFPFEKVAEAHAAIESGTTIGKLVLLP
jgi:NADPH:quinone reductase-like Zn-dependent oxidoreductase